MIPGSANTLLLASAAAAGGYQIERSLRFNSSDSAYLSRTPSTAGNRKTWTWAGWVKRSGLDSGTQYSLFSNNGNNNTTFGLIAFFGNNISIGGYIINYLVTSAVYRDPSAWLHVVVVMDTTQATASNRLKVYVNGSEVTVFSTDNRSSISQNSDQGINQAVSHAIGRQDTGSGSQYFSGCLADIHFIDGQALDPSSFGEFDTNNVWQPKAYSGSYGTNGFHLDFADNSNNTATTLGKDTSGNGNNWTPNNLSVTAGAGNDSLRDSPSSPAGQTDSGAGGTVVGNYCTWNPLDKSGNATFSNGNLDAQTGASGYGTTRGTIGVSSGKWYWEVTFNSTDASNDCYIGILDITGALANELGGNSKGYAYWASNGNKYNNASFASYGASYAPGDVVGVALDLNAGTLVFYKNGSSQGTAYSSLSGTFCPAFSDSGGSNIGVIANFGQRPFAYTAPSGFKALCTANLPSTTITTSGSYTGNGVADGPFVYLNGVPTAMTVNGNAVTFGTHADKLSNGFNVRTTSTTYNQNASTYNYTITTTGDPFKTARAQSNP